MNRSIFEMQADFCKAMGNAARQQIIHTLRERQMKVSDIAQVTGLSQTLVSRQLSTLRNAGVVKFQRQGSETIYQLTDDNIGKVCDLVRKVLSAQLHRQSEAFSAGDA
ncbi:MAG TPA: metalloregulator ArsR/SmtB family transcription factor [Anaerolineales bacterium]|nr:metalloregulator ArsR/SmtB family transcription factor [Anaerolineales bacterium]